MKFLRAPFLTEYLRWLLLSCYVSYFLYPCISYRNQSIQSNDWFQYEQMIDFNVNCKDETKWVNESVNRFNISEIKCHGSAYTFCRTLAIWWKKLPQMRKTRFSEFLKFRGKKMQQKLAYTCLYTKISFHVLQNKHRNFFNSLATTVVQIFIILS